MTDALYGGWIDLAVVGFFAAGGCEAWLVYAQAPKKAFEAIAAAAEGRDALLAKSTSDAGWARLVRVAMRGDGSPDVAGGYRDGRASASPELVRAFAAELSRLRRVRGAGLVGVGVMLASTVPMFFARPFVAIGATFVAVAALLAWGVVAGARRARSALEQVYEALPALATRLGPAPPPRTVNGWQARIDLQPGILSAALLAFVAVVALPMFLVDAAAAIPASYARATILSNLVIAPLLVRSVFTRAGSRLEFDRDHLELLITRHMLGLPLFLTRVPLEIVRGASTRPTPATRPGNSVKLLVLELTVPAAEIRLYSGYGTLRAAAALNGLLQGS